MKFFAIHILIKDLSYMIFYLIILKYNLSHETYLPSTISNFPTAAEITFSEIFSNAFVFNILPLLVSLATYYPIFYVCRKFLKKRNSTYFITTALMLTLTTPIVYLLLNNQSTHIMKAEIFAWILCFTISIISYYLLNKKTTLSN